MKNYLCSAIIIFLACGVSKKQEVVLHRVEKPSWIYSLAKHPYGSNDYVAYVVHTKLEVFTVDTNGESETSARKIFIERVLSDSNKERLPNDFSVDSFEEEFSFIEIVERYYDHDERMLYVLTVLNKKTFKDYVLEKLTDARKLIQESVLLAGKFEQEENYTRMMISYLQALSLLNYYEPKQYLYKKMFGDEMFADLSRAEIEGALENSILNVRIDIVSGNNQKGKREEPLPELVRLFVYYSHNGSKIPLSHFPIRAQKLTAEAQIEASVATDDNGFIELSISKVFDSPHDLNIIEVELDFEKFIGTKNKLIPVKTNVIYTISDQVENKAAFKE